MWLLDFLFGKHDSPPKPMAAPNTPATDLSDAAFDLITNAEGLDQPYLFPGGDSGITIGIGDDLGYQTLGEFTDKWKSVLSPADFSLLTSAIGVTGINAARIARNFREVKIDRAAAISVFRQFTVPDYIAKTRAAFPGVDSLCANAFGAMVSLVYNRGPSTTGSRRIEMANIKTILAQVTNPASAEVYKAIATQFRSMKRLWIGVGLDGLVTRREAEAKLVESCLS